MPIFCDLVALNQPARTIETLQYLNGTHPRYGGPPPAPVPPEPPVTRDALRAHPPALPVLRRGVADLDPAPPGDEPENPEDSELATLPRRQQALADQIREDLGQNQRVTQRALIQYRDELSRPQAEIILEILKEAFLTMQAGIAQARREGALDDDALAAWATFETNHGLYLAHFPFDAARERLYRNAPVDIDRADPVAVAEAFEGFLDTLENEAVAGIVGPRLKDWAERSAAFGRVIVAEAQAVAMRGDIPDEDMPHRVWLRRQVGQGWALMERIATWLVKTEEGRVIGLNVAFASGVATLLAALRSLLF